MPKPWFSVKALGGPDQDDQGSAELSIRGIIGDYGLTDADLIQQVSALGDVASLLVRINSIGGDAAQGLAIFNYLNSLDCEVTVRVEGVAMSSASVIAMVASPGKLIMPANTIMMMHHPWTIAAGNAKDLRATADDLDAWSQAVIQTYLARSGMTPEALDAFLDEERSLTAAEAVEMGFADVVEPLQKQTGAQSSVTRQVMACMGLPDEVLAKIQAIEEAAAAVVDKVGDGGDGGLVLTAGVDTLRSQTDDTSQPTLAAQIKAVLASSDLDKYADVFLLDPSLTSLDQVNARVVEAREISELCDLAGYPQLSAGLIQSRASRQDACDRITRARAEAADKNPTDGHPPATQNGAPLKSEPPAAITTAGIWAARNAIRK